MAFGWVGGCVVATTKLANFLYAGNGIEDV